MPAGLRGLDVGVRRVGVTDGSCEPADELSRHLVGLAGGGLPADEVAVDRHAPDRIPPGVTAAGPASPQCPARRSRGPAVVPGSGSCPGLPATRPPTRR